MTAIDYEGNRAIGLGALATVRRPAPLNIIVGSVLLFYVVTVGSGTGWQSIAAGKATELYVENGLSKYSFFVWGGCYPFLAAYAVFNWRKVFDYLSHYLLIIAMTSLAFVSCIWAESPSASLYVSGQLVVLTFFTIAIAGVLNVDQAFRVLIFSNFFIIFVTLIFVFALPEYGIMQRPSQGAWRGSFIEKNVLAQAMTYAFGFCLVALHAWRFPVNLIAGIMLVITTVIIYNTKTVNAFFTVIISILVFYAVYFLKQSKRHACVVYGLCLIGLGVCSLATLFVREILDLTGRSLNFTGRDVIWEYLISSIVEFPISGFGYAQFWKSTDEFGGHDLTYGLNWHPEVAHNAALEIGVQLGVGGIVLFFMFIVQTTARMMTLAENIRDKVSIWPILIFFQMW